MSVALEIMTTGLDEALLKIDGLAEAPRFELMEGIGRLVQEQTRRRIEEEKNAPDGSAWRPNIAGTSLLYASGALSRSIDYAAANDSVQVGTGLRYAGIHQGGGEIVPKDARALVFPMGNRLVFSQRVRIPARPYVGLSAANQTDVVEAAEDWVARLLQ